MQSPLTDDEFANVARSVETALGLPSRACTGEPPPRIPRGQERSGAGPLTGPEAQSSGSRKWACAAATRRAASDCHASTRTLATRRPWRMMVPRANVSSSRHGRR